MDFVTVENIMWAIAIIAAIVIVWRVITAPSRQAETDDALYAANRDGLDTRERPRHIRRGERGYPFPQVDDDFDAALMAERMRTATEGDPDDDFDDGFSDEDLLDAIETVSNFADSMQEERHPDFPNVAKDGLESEMAPTYDPPARESFHRSEPAIAPARETSGSTYDSDSGGDDSGDD